MGNKYWVQINDKNTAIITQFEGYNEIKLFKKGELTYEFKDKYINETSFMIILGNRNFTFKNNKLILLTIDKLAKYIQPLIRVKALTNKFITMDIETF